MCNAFLLNDLVVARTQRVAISQDRQHFNTGNAAFISCAPCSTRCRACSRNNIRSTWLFGQPILQPQPCDWATFLRLLPLQFSVPTLHTRRLRRTALFPVICDLLECVSFPSSWPPVLASIPANQLARRSTTMTCCSEASSSPRFPPPYRRLSLRPLQRQATGPPTSPRCCRPCTPAVGVIGVVIAPGTHSTCTQGPAAVAWAWRTSRRESCTLRSTM